VAHREGVLPGVHQFLELVLKALHVGPHVLQ
jgi:hypothetical protein